jgi:hypothetical protein
MRTCVPHPCPTPADHFRASGQLRQAWAASGEPETPSTTQRQATIHHNQPERPNHAQAAPDTRPPYFTAQAPATHPEHLPPCSTPSVLPVTPISHPPRRMGPGHHGRQRDDPANTLLQGIDGCQRPIELPPGHGAGRDAAGWGTGARLGWGREQVEQWDWLGRCARSCRARNEGWMAIVGSIRRPSTGAARECRGHRR